MRNISKATNLKVLVAILASLWHCILDMFGLLERALRPSQLSGNNVSGLNNENADKGITVFFGEDTTSADSELSLTSI